MPLLTNSDMAERKCLHLHKAVVRNVQVGLLQTDSYGQDGFTGQFTPLSPLLGHARSMALMAGMGNRDFTLPRRLGVQEWACEDLSGKAKAESGHERSEQHDALLPVLKGESWKRRMRLAKKRRRRRRLKSNFAPIDSMVM